MLTSLIVRKQSATGSERLRSEDPDADTAVRRIEHFQTSRDRQYRITAEGPQLTAATIRANGLRAQSNALGIRES